MTGRLRSYRVSLLKIIPKSYGASEKYYEWPYEEKSRWVDEDGTTYDTEIRGYVQPNQGYYVLIGSGAFTRRYSPDDQVTQENFVDVLYLYKKNEKEIYGYKNGSLRTKDEKTRFPSASPCYLEYADSAKTDEELLELIGSDRRPLSDNKKLVEANEIVKVYVPIPGVLENHYF